MNLTRKQRIFLILLGTLISSSINAINPKDSEGSLIEEQNKWPQKHID